MSLRLTPQDSLSPWALRADPSDRIGKEFLKRLQEVSGCSSQDFSPWLKHTQGQGKRPPSPLPT